MTSEVNDEVLKMNDRSTSNLRIIYLGKNYYLHKAVFKDSEYFKARSNWSDNSMVVLEIPNVSGDAFDTMMKLLYSTDLHRDKRDLITSTGMVASLYRLLVYLAYTDEWIRKLFDVSLLADLMITDMSDDLEDVVNAFGKDAFCDWCMTVYGCDTGGDQLLHANLYTFPVIKYVVGERGVKGLTNDFLETFLNHVTYADLPYEDKLFIRDKVIDPIANDIVEAHQLNPCAEHCDEISSLVYTLLGFMGIK